MKENHWYFLQDNTKRGPFNESQIRRMMAMQTLTPETKLWNVTLNNWVPLGQTVFGKPTNISPGESISSASTGNEVAGQMRTKLVKSAEKAAGAAVCAPFGLLRVMFFPRSSMRMLTNTSAFQGQALALIILGNLAMAPLSWQPERLPEGMPYRRAMLLGLAGLLTFSLLYFYFVSGLLAVTGRWIGGLANRFEVRLALGYASVPRVCIFLVWGIAFWYYRDALFASDPYSAIPAGRHWHNGLIAFHLTMCVVGIWSLVVWLKCLGQVHGFSIFRAFANLILAGIIVLVPAVAFVCALAYFLSAFQS